MGETTPPSNGENRQWVIKVAAWPLFSVCTILVALRIWTRARIARPLGWDDAFIVLAMVGLLMIMNGHLLIVAGLRDGGKHFHDHQRASWYRTTCCRTH